MILVSVHKFKVPEFLLPALYDGDISDFDDRDIAVLDAANLTFKQLCSGKEYFVVGKPKSEKYFTHNPDFINLGCDVVDINVSVLV